MLRNAMPFGKGKDVLFIKDFFRHQIFQKLRRKRHNASLIFGNVPLINNKMMILSRRNNCQLIRFNPSARSAVYKLDLTAHQKIKFIKRMKLLASKNIDIPASTSEAHLRIFANYSRIISQTDHLPFIISNFCRKRNVLTIKCNLHIKNINLYLS